MSKQPWLTSEAGALSALRQGAELCRAGLLRPWLTLCLVLAATAAVVGVLEFGAREYAPKFVLRVVEAQHPSGNVPPLKRQLAEYVRQGVFTSEPLYELMRRHGLYASLMHRNARSALEAFKEDISIDVYQNYFVEDRGRKDAPRSARLTVSFRSKDPHLALAVTRELGALIVQHELAARRDQALSSAKGAAQARDTLVGELQRRSADVIGKQDEISRAAVPDPRQQVELVGLLGSLGALEHQVEAAERRAATLDLGAALERHGIGLAFEVVDDGSLPGKSGQRQTELLAGGTTFIWGLPLLAMAVGAFAPIKRGQT